jgi:hypothetical protein
MTTICFTGNHNGLTYTQKEQIRYILDKYNRLIISHGDCMGSCSDFHNLCLEYKREHLDKDIQIHIYPPTNPQLRAFTPRTFNSGDVLMKPKPYLDRNLHIIKKSSILIACPIDKYKEEMNSCTWDMIRQAYKYNLLVYLL